MHVLVEFGGALRDKPFNGVVFGTQWRSICCPQQTSRLNRDSEAPPIKLQWDAELEQPDGEAPSRIKHQPLATCLTRIEGPKRCGRGCRVPVPSNVTAMATKSARRRKQDRARVAGGEDYEVAL
jgi:hypothetical protein